MSDCLPYQPAFYVREMVTMHDGSHAYYFVRGPFATADDAQGIRRELRLRLPQKTFHCVQVRVLNHASDDSERVIYPAWGRK